MLWGDRAAFTEQGASASQVTEDNFLDQTSRPQSKTETLGFHCWFSGFPLSEAFSVILWEDCCGKESTKMYISNRSGKKYQRGVSLRLMESNYSFVIQMVGKKEN